MEVCGIYIEKIENKGRALWVLGVFAREKEGTMPARARARAAAGGGRPVPGRAQAWARVWVWVWVPYLAWFFLNRVSRVWVTPLPDPLQPANGCPRERIRTVRQPLSENRPCGWAVERLRRFCPNRRNCCLLADENTLPERYK